MNEKHWTDWVPRVSWVLIALLVAMSLLGCKETGPKIGQTTAEITQIMGKPYGVIRTEDGRDNWFYDTAMVSFQAGVAVDIKEANFK